MGSKTLLVKQDRVWCLRQSPAVLSVWTRVLGLLLTAAVTEVRGAGDGARVVVLAGAPQRTAKPMVSNSLKIEPLVEEWLVGKSLSRLTDADLSTPLCSAAECYTVIVSILFKLIPETELESVK